MAPTSSLREKAHPRHSCKHLTEVSHYLVRLLGGAHDPQKALVADEEDAAGGSALPLQLLPQCLLDLPT